MSSDRAETANTSLADHVVESVDSLADLHQDHYRNASDLQRVIDRITDLLGQPPFVLALFILMGFWLGFALFFATAKTDESMLACLEDFASIAALLVAVLILATQRREDQLADRRAQLTLQLAIISDKKSAKIIALLEEFRRDQPNVADRIDRESDEMSKPADPKDILAEIEERGVRDSAVD